jgi:capsular polysaccharide biosynthesis protein
MQIVSESRSNQGVAKVAYRKAYWWFYEHMQLQVANILRNCPGSSALFGPPRHLRSSLKELLPSVDSIADLFSSDEDVWMQMGPSTEMTFTPPQTLSGRTEYMKEVAGTFKQPEAMLFALYQARLLSGEGTVVTARDELFSEASPWGVDDLRGKGINNQIIPARMTHLRGAYVHATGAWTSGYFHWIFDILTRLVPLLKYEEIKDLPLIVPMDFSKLHEESLRHLGFKNFVPQPSSHVLVEKLFFPTSVRVTHCPPRWVLDEMRARFGVKEKVARRRLYISRNDANRRRIINEEEIVALLKPYGFETLLLSGRSLCEQMEVFSEAEIIIGSNGSGFANLLFAPEKARVLELFAPTYFYGGYHALATTLGMDYTYLVGEAVGETDIMISKDLMRIALIKWGLAS